MVYAVSSAMHLLCCQAGTSGAATAFRRIDRTFQQARACAERAGRNGT
jgi:hypothetical protein